MSSMSGLLRSPNPSFRIKSLTLTMKSTDLTIRSFHHDSVIPQLLPRIPSSRVLMLSPLKSALKLRSIDLANNDDDDGDFTSSMLHSLRILDTLKSYSTSMKECLTTIETELEEGGERSENESLDSISKRLRNINSVVSMGSSDLKAVISVLEGKLPESVDMGQVVILKLQISSCFLQWRRFLSHLSEFYTDVVLCKQGVSILELDLVVELGSAAILEALEDIDQSILEAEASIKDLAGVIDVVPED